MMNASFADINLANIRHNLQQIKRLSGCDRIMAPVKANAYGHGLVPVAKFLEKQKVEYLAVAYSSEGRTLREEGIRIPILVLSAVEDPMDIIKYGLTPTLISIDCARNIHKILKKSGKIIPVHLDIDTGMGRTGLLPDEAERAYKEMMGMGCFSVEGLYTHLSSSDDKDDPFTKKQLSLFHLIYGRLKKLGANPKYIHCANSGGILNHDDSLAKPFNMIRPGIIMYGCSPDNNPIRNADIRPALSLKSKIIYIKKVKPRTAIGYNHTYRSKTDERIATLSIGYGDGLSRLLSNKGKTLVLGKISPIVGRISMDLTTIRLARSNKAKVGDHAVFIGTDKGITIKAEEMASLIKTIPYELFCHLNERVKRIYSAS